MVLFFCPASIDAPAETPSRLSWPKGAVYVVKHGLGPLKDNNHIRVVGMAWIGELERH